MDKRGLKEKYCLVYNLSYHAGLELFLPSANICSIDGTGRPSYLIASALPENIESYELPYFDSIHKTLIDICVELSIASLEKNFNKSGKKPIRLTGLFSEHQTQKAIHIMMEKKLVKFLEVIRSNNLYLSYNIQRKIKAADILLSFSDLSANPMIYFVKTQTGIKYQLKLAAGNEIKKPSEQNIQIIANHPGIILINNVVTYLTQINANKLKPFFNKDFIFIPDKIAKQYFEQFILDILNKVDAEVEGFEVIKVNQISKKKICFVFDLFKDKWVFEVKFEYGQIIFSNLNPSTRKNHIDFNDNGEIIVNQCIRNLQEESLFIDLIQSYGFTQDENKRFTSGETKFDVFHSLALYSELLNENFEIETPIIDEKVIHIIPSKLSPNFTKTNDWFDLAGLFFVGNESFPIARLFSNIRRNDPFFKLSDGNYFIIPDIYFARFEHVIKFAKGDHLSTWKLSKEYLSLINEAEITKVNGENYFEEDEKVEYEPSSLLRAELRPYQLEGASWLIAHRKNNLGACLADDMGLGKTIQTIAALLDAKENLPKNNETKSRTLQLDLFGELIENKRNPLQALIILPASLVYNWHFELYKYAPSLHVVRYSGAGRKKLSNTLFTFDIILTTYQTAVADLDFLKTFEFNYLVLDESQHIRNKESKVFKSLNQLMAKHKISLSGTPIENSLTDLWAQMEFINPDILKSYSFFKKNYQIPIEKNRDDKVIKELKLLVDPFILRRTKEQVAKDLPELTENVHYSEMSPQQSKIFETEKSAARNLLLSLDTGNKNFKFHVLSSLIRLRQISNHPLLVDNSYKEESGKFEDIKNQISTIVKSGHKVLVFSSFISYLSLLERWLDSCSYKYVKLTGSMNSEDRQKAVDSFQTKDSIQIFLLSLKAGGTGLNLTAADYVFILDPWWNPFAENQAIARAHRIGRKRNVFVTRFISKDSIEEKILSLQSKKRALSDEIIEVNSMPNITEKELLELLE